MRVLQVSSSAPNALRHFQTSPLKPSEALAHSRAHHTGVIVAVSSGLWNATPCGLLSSSRVFGLSIGRIAVVGASPWRAQKSSKLVVRGRKNQVVCMAAAESPAVPPVEVLVKAATGQPDQLGDCPFSQRVLLTLEEKGVPYEAKYIDTSNKPAWFLEVNPGGKVPVIKDEGKWVADSDVITELLEKKFPNPRLAAPPATVGGNLFGAFVQFLASKDPSDGKEQALLKELKALEAHLKDNGPYLNGEQISALDLALAPKLYHLKVALGHYKKWSIPADFKSLHSYIESVHSRDSFVKTKAPESVVIKGWEAKVLGA